MRRARHLQTGSMASAPSLVEAAGPFIWPLAACSLGAAFITVERGLALASSRTVPDAVLEAVRTGRAASAPPGSLAARVLAAWSAGVRGEALVALAESELVALQRGLFLLDTVVGLAPLLGLLGTVTGLAALFPEQGLPEASTLTRGVGLALSTTILGLGVAIPSQLAANWLARRVEVVSARVNLMIRALEAPRRS